MPLQVDATIEYALPEHKSRALLCRSGIDSPYNSYIHAGLPPTPIANPGRPSLEAALHPATSESLYYVYCGEGRHVFAKTLAEHQANVARCLYTRKGVETMPSSNGESGMPHTPLELKEALNIETKDGASLRFEVVGILEDPQARVSYAVLVHEPRRRRRGAVHRDRSRRKSLGERRRSRKRSSTTSWTYAEEDDETRRGREERRLNSRPLSLRQRRRRPPFGGQRRAVGVAATRPDGTRRAVVDSYKYAALVVSRVVSDGYMRMVKTIPQMYRYIYDRAERATEVGTISRLGAPVYRR